MAERMTISQNDMVVNSADKNLIILANKNIIILVKMMKIKFFKNGGLLWRNI